MCGIGGIVLGSIRNLPDLRERLAAMTDAMTHRGPDDGGIYLSPDFRTGLVNRRLAIRDLSPAGHMPMSNQDGTVWITYNGEIYNAEEIRAELEQLGYAFRSTSDTEVILHGFEAWGSAITRRLRGMFAFAIVRLDAAGQQVKQVCLARDRLGIKPLYYAQPAEALLFASELGVLHASRMIPDDVSAPGLIGYLAFGSVPEPWTICDSVKALPPAHVLTWEQGRITLEPYWHFPTEAQSSIAYRDAVERVRAELTEAVRSQLVSDVPLGAFLSGGLDSSAVVSLMRASTTGVIRTCAMVFEEQAYSEAPFARAMADAVDAEHFERVITANEVTRELDSILDAMDQPTVDGVNSYFVSQTARQAGLTVALSGLGGDELFGGYANTFQGVPQMQRALSRIQAIPAGASMARGLIRLWPDRHRWSKVNDALGAVASAATAYVTRRGLFAPSEIQALVWPEVWAAAQPHFEPFSYGGKLLGDGGVPGQVANMTWVSRAELSMYTRHQLLRDTDVMSMAHSLEVRVPLLDDRLVEAMLKLPDAVKQHGVGSKPLLRAAIADRLPPVVRNRSGKQGFTFPFDVWLRTAWRQLVEVALAEATPGWLRMDGVRAMWQSFLAGRVHWSRPWSLFVLSRWLAGRGR